MPVIARRVHVDSDRVELWALLPLDARAVALHAVVPGSVVVRELYDAS